LVPDRACREVDEVNALKSFILSIVFAALFTGLGVWAILRPQKVIDSVVHPDDRRLLAGQKWLWFVRALGIAFILIGIGQLVDTLLR
jgi:hypothetical protein